MKQNKDVFVSKENKEIKTTCDVAKCLDFLCEVGQKWSKSENISFL